MKNSAIREMIVNQFNWVDRNDISVTFTQATGNQYEFDVSLMDDGVYKEFTVKVEMEEKPNGQ